MAAGQKRFLDSARLTFTTTLIGDTVDLSGEKLVVVQKFQTERRLMLRPAARETALPRSVSESEYNGARPTLVADKGDA
jgi:hypothetical protein